MDMSEKNYIERHLLKMFWCDKDTETRVSDATAVISPLNVLTH